MDTSVVAQRYRAVLAVERGEPMIVVAAQFGASRQTLHSWLVRYARDGLAGVGGSVASTRRVCIRAWPQVEAATD